MNKLILLAGLWSTILSAQRINLGQIQATTGNVPVLTDPLSVTLTIKSGASQGNNVLVALKKGLLQGYGMTGTGLDTPTVQYLADGTLAAPSNPSFPASTWSRITNSNYTSGLGAFVFYTMKNGGSNGIETVTVSSRNILPSDQVGVYIRTVGSYGNQVITGVTNTSPIVVTLATPCYCSTGQGVHIAGVGGTTAANNDWTITVVSPTVFSLNGSTGNGSYTSGGTASLQGPWTITGATNASPIVITTDAPYNLTLNTEVQIAGIVGNTAANNSWNITPITSTTFSLQGSTGNGAYVSGGTALFYQTNWSIVAACQKTSAPDQCTNEINTANLSGVDAPAIYGSAPGLMNGLAIVGLGNAKLSQAIYVGNQNPGVSVWQRGIDIAPGSMLANAPALVLPNTTRISSYNSAGSATTDLLWQDSLLNTIFNSNSSGYMYFAVNGIGKGYMDNGGIFHFPGSGDIPQGVITIGACSSSIVGEKVWVTDALSNVYGTVVTTGGGPYSVGLSCNGTNWSVYASGVTASALTPYTLCASGCSATIPSSPFTITAATHGQGANAMVICFDNATPHNMIFPPACPVTESTLNGDLVFSYVSAPSKIIIK